ncbi:LIC_13387 family protein [Emcibacter nanhaiensis]|uniref:Uncharacterized protein n=1 Tax=Emcibacter nanhaiensis TaxID=1505037 RepID=A0A501PQ15_9PROT|nr:hypothetical protein [Emcibacter nanhaiensis]TPD61791.1 hypothetical protein FIV46_06170 [Emcibacter nanhaiensis]
MDQILIIIGAAILGLLGVVHLVYTFFTPRFEPYDPAAIEAMQGSTLRLTRETTVWKAWIGFNASHSFGPMLFAAIYIPLALWHMELIRGSLWFSNLPLLLGLGYLVLARCYWFRIPFVGILLSCLCFAAAAVMIHF